VQALRIALAGVMALTAAGMPASACPYEKAQKAKTAYAPSDNGAESIKKVTRGDKLAIACDGVDLSGDVRVVLNVSESGAKKLGYKGVLATDQSRSQGHLQIRVPDAPDLANHTVNLKVFVMNGETATACDAGKVRVV